MNELSVRERYLEELHCIFSPDNGRPIEARNNTAKAHRDLYPVSKGHTLVMPVRHVRCLFELSNAEYQDCWELVRRVVDRLSRGENKPRGFNIGMNVGKAAGQTVMHAHIHIIPRYDGDVENPRGGIRGVIPEKSDYETNEIEAAIAGGHARTN